MFENARVLNSEEMYDGDSQTAHENKIPGTDLKIMPRGGKLFSLQLKIMQTPGHSQEHCSLVVQTASGTYVIAGDVFWWADGEKHAVDIEKEDSAHPNEVNMKKLTVSRKNILKIADYVIPGHGEMFKVEK